jgi:hypothetical protein
MHLKEGCMINTNLTPFTVEAFKDEGKELLRSLIGIKTIQHVQKLYNIAILFPFCPTASWCTNFTLLKRIFTLGNECGERCFDSRIPESAKNYR